MSIETLCLALFYDTPPEGKIMLDDIDGLCRERLEMLKVFDSNKIDYASISSNPNHYSWIKQQLDDVPSPLPGGAQNFLKILMASPNCTKQSERNEAAFRDTISHFLLRLYYCKNRFLTQWYVEHESELLRFRLMLDQHNVTNFINWNCLPFNIVEDEYEEVNNEECLLQQVVIKKSRCSLSHKRLITEQSSLIVGINSHQVCNKSSKSKYKYSISKKEIFSLSDNNSSKSFYQPLIDSQKRMSDVIYGDQKQVKYKVRFEDALQLVKNRKVVPKNGFIILTPYQMIPILCQLFRQELEKCLNQLRQKLPELDENRRLTHVIESLHKQIIGIGIFNVDDCKVVPTESVDKLLVSFPPCMFNLYKSLNHNHHLRHFGRLQLGLFLKSIGLRMHQLNYFFKQHFTKKMSEEDYDKKYNYFIRYLYGQSGKRINFSCYSCKKILNCITPGAQDNHGCPFKEFSSERMLALLKMYQLPESTCQSILKLCSSKEYQLACTQFYHSRHPVDKLDENIYHPKQFYNQSRKYLSV